MSEQEPEKGVQMAEMDLENGEKITQQNMEEDVKMAPNTEEGVKNSLEGEKIASEDKEKEVKKYKGGEWACCRDPIGHLIAFLLCCPCYTLAMLLFLFFECICLPFRCCCHINLLYKDPK